MAETSQISTGLTPETTIKVLHGDVSASRIFSKTDSGDLRQLIAAPEPTYGKLKKAISHIEEFISSHSRQLEFSVHEESGRTVITVRERGSGEIIRQIPPEEVLAIATSISAQEQDSSGILLKTRT